MDVNNVLLCLPFKTTTFVIVLINKKIEIISIYWMLYKNLITTKMPMFTYQEAVVLDEETKQYMLDVATYKADNARKAAEKAAKKLLIMT